MRILDGLAIGLAIALFGGCMRAPIYYPTHTDAATLERLAGARQARTERLRVDDGLELVGFRRDPTAEQPTLLFFGGNAMAITDSLEVLSLITTARSWGIAAFAYRGYDGSGGSPAEKELCADAARIVEHLGVPSNDLFLVGQSLGTGIAVHTARDLSAAGHAPAGVILISPYTSLTAVANDLFGGLPVGLLLSDRYQTDAKLDELTSPVLVVHGARDEVIGVTHGKEVAAQLGEKATLRVLPTAGHNDIWLYEEAAEAVRTFVEQHHPADEGSH